MEYSLYELTWIYLGFSFIGWCIEVAAAAIQKRKFLNRGFVTGPVCPIYGTGAVAFAIFLPELSGNPFFLFLGGMILASFIELVTGTLLEKIFGRKWWDYSQERFSLGGYICLKFSLIWGAMALCLIYVGNQAFLTLISLLPYLAGLIAICVLLGLLAVDAAGTCIAILGMKKKAAISQITEGIGNVSKLLENAITLRIQKRMVRAYPAIGDLQAGRDTGTETFGKGCSFYKLASLFLIGAFLGDLTETVFCRLALGEWMSRSSVVWGHFSVVWGLGCVLLTAFLYSYREKNDRYVFIAGTVLGGAYEYVCSVFTELAFGTVFWDYSGFAFNLGGRINLLYCFFWGIVAVVWLKLIYPFLSGLIERVPVKPGKIICNLLIAFMLVNMLVSSLALARYTERNTVRVEAGKEAGALDSLLDAYFPDDEIERIYPKAKIVE